MEARTGVEPVNNGFANHCLSHLAIGPSEGEFIAGRIHLVDRQVVPVTKPDGTVGTGLRGVEACLVILKNL